MILCSTWRNLIVCLEAKLQTNKQTKQSFSVFCDGYINKIFGLGIFKVPTIVTVEHST